MTDDVIDAEVMDGETAPSTALAVRSYGTGALAAANPSESLARASAMASALRPVITNQKLSKNIQGKEYVMVEGWTTLAALMGMTPMEVSNKDIGNGVYEAVVELVNAEGRSVGRASAECGDPDEVDRSGNPVWANRPAYARRSMANTRATSKVCRQVLSWVMTLAGYAPTPAEEMDFVETQQPKRDRPVAQGGTLPIGYDARWTGEVKLKSGKNAGKRWNELPEKLIAFLVGKDNELAQKEMARRLYLEMNAERGGAPPALFDEIDEVPY